MASHLLISVGQLCNVSSLLLLLAAVLPWIYPLNEKEHEESRLPRPIPYTLPLLKSTFSFLFNGATLLSHASHVGRNDSVLKVPLLTDDLYLVHGAKHVSEMFRVSSLSVTWSMGYVLRVCFGMSRQAADMYHKDTSGPRKMTNPGSITKAHDRIYFKTHETLLEGLLGKGLPPMTDRLTKELEKSIASLQISHEWTEFPDLEKFYQDCVGAAVVKTIFGNVLLSRNPNFLDYLWEFDSVVMRLAQRLPIFCAPRTYWLRYRLLKCIKNWHTFARIHSTGYERDNGEDSDPLWGCRMIRDRFARLRDINNQDYDSLASTDLAFIWSAVANVVPSSMALLLHAIGDSTLLAEVQQEVATVTESSAQPAMWVKAIEQQPLLLSMYAETLRHGVQIHIPRDIPHQSLTLGNRTIPKDQIVFVNTWLAHTDPAVWNTKDGVFPTDEFWARRFIIDPKDPSSGPCKNQRNFNGTPATASESTSKPRYSTEGLEGAWVPYGGGHHACPGRVLAKRTMLLSCAMMISTFDIELLTGSEKPEFRPSRFGFGVQKPTSKVAFRIRKRQPGPTGSTDS